MAGCRTERVMGGIQAKTHFPLHPFSPPALPCSYFWIRHTANILQIAYTPCIPSSWLDVNRYLRGWTATVFLVEDVGKGGTRKGDARGAAGYKRWATYFYPDWSWPICVPGVHSKESRITAFGMAIIPFSFYNAKPRVCVIRFTSPRSPSLFASTLAILFPPLLFSESAGYHPCKFYDDHFNNRRTIDACPLLPLSFQRSTSTFHTQSKWASGGIVSNGLSLMGVIGS